MTEQIPSGTAGFELVVAIAGALARSVSMELAVIKARLADVEAKVGVAPIGPEHPDAPEGRARLMALREEIIRIEAHARDGLFEAIHQALEEALSRQQQD